MLFLNMSYYAGKRRKKSPAVKAGESKSDKAKSVRKYTKKRSGCQIYNYQKKSVFIKRCSFAIPIPKPLSPGKAVYAWLALHRAEPLGIHARHPCRG